MAEEHSQPRSGALRCVVVTPETTVLDESADFVALPLFDGEKGVAYNHTPLVGRLGFGELRIRQGSQVRRYYVDGGFAEVAGNVVSVLTERAIPAEKLDVKAIGSQLDANRQRPANSPELMEIRDRLVAQNRAQLRLARKGQTYSAADATNLASPH